MSRFCRLVCLWVGMGCGLPTGGHAAHDGGLDTGFQAGAGAADDVFSAAVLPDGGLLLGGYFTSFDGQERWRVARLGKDGTPDPRFDPGESSGAAPVTRVTAGTDGSLFVAGSFGRFGGLARPVVARLGPDGKADARFDASAAFAGEEGRVNALVTEAGGTLLVGGRFDPSAGRRQGTAELLARLRADGQRDDGFRCEATAAGREDSLKALALLPDGKILIGTRGGLTRLSKAGARDAGFRPADELAGAVTALAAQADGRVVAATLRPGAGWKIARVEADGKLDGTFHPVEAAGEAAGTVEALTLQRDGKVLVGGSFREIGGVRRHGLARLNADGTPDREFDPGTGVETLPLDEADETPEATVHVLLPLPGGGLLVAGRFDLYNGVVCHNVARVVDGAAGAAAPVVRAETP